MLVSGTNRVERFETVLVTIRRALQDLQKGGSVETERRCRKQGENNFIYRGNGIR